MNRRAAGQPLLLGRHEMGAVAAEHEVVGGIGESFGARMSASGPMERTDQPKTTSGGLSAMAIYKILLMRQPMAGDEVLSQLKRRAS